MSKTPATQPVEDGSDSITVDFLASFSKKRQDIEELINSVNTSTRQINSLTDQIQTAFNPEDLEKLHAQTQTEIKKAQTIGTKGKSLLDKLKAEGDAIVKANPRSDRIQPYKLQYLRLCKLYVDAMKEHQKAKERMKQVQTEMMVRRGTIAYGDSRTEAEIRERAERDPTGFLREAIMEEASEEAQMAYNDAQSRARDVEMLIRSINEVAAMFQDLAVLVQQQSEMLDNIEANVEQAQTYVKKGNEQIRQAIKYQKKTRKCYCCLIIILIIIIVAVIAGVGGALGGVVKTG